MMKILLDLQKHLENDRSIIGLSIKNAKKESVAEVIKMIQSQAQDNFESIKEIIGESLLNRIQCIKF